MITYQLFPGSISWVKEANDILIVDMPTYIYLCHTIGRLLLTNI